MGAGFAGRCQTDNGIEWARALGTRTCRVMLPPSATSPSPLLVSLAAACTGLVMYSITVEVSLYCADRPRSAASKT